MNRSVGWQDGFFCALNSSQIFDTSSFADRSIFFLLSVVFNIISPLFYRTATSAEYLRPFATFVEINKNTSESRLGIRKRAFKCQKLAAPKLSRFGVTSLQLRTRPNLSQFKNLKIRQSTHFMQ